MAFLPRNVARGARGAGHSVLTTDAGGDLTSQRRTSASAAASNGTDAVFDAAGRKSGLDMDLLRRARAGNDRASEAVGGVSWAADALDEAIDDDLEAAFRDASAAKRSSGEGPAREASLDDRLPPVQPRRSRADVLAKLRADMAARSAAQTAQRRAASTTAPSAAKAEVVEDAISDIFSDAGSDYDPFAGAQSDEDGADRPALAQDLVARARPRAADYFKDEPATSSETEAPMTADRFLALHKADLIDAARARADARASELDDARSPSDSIDAPQHKRRRVRFDDE